jgi:hypothetical protein
LIALEDNVTDKIQVAYDPTIQALLAQCESDWGDPQINRDGLVPYGLPPIDRSLYGIDIIDGELILIQGQEKRRKTTFAANVVVNIMIGEKPKEKPVIDIESLESGMSPKKYRDSLISIMATRYLMSLGHQYGQACPVCGTPQCRELGISSKFLRYNTRSTDQQEAVTYALDTMFSWPLLIHGANPLQGDTRNLKSVSNGKDARWRKLIDDTGVKIMVVDHAQQFSFAGEPSDYEKQIKAVSVISDFVAQNNMVYFLLSQVSLTSLREVRAGVGNLTAAGGAKGAQESNTVFTTDYASGSGVMKISIEESRYSANFSVWQHIEDTSGAFIGEASTTPPLGG